MEGIQKKRSYFSSWLNESNSNSSADPNDSSSSYSLEEIKTSHYEKIPAVSTNVLTKNKL